MACFCVKLHAFIVSGLTSHDFSFKIAWLFLGSMPHFEANAVPESCSCAGCIQSSLNQVKCIIIECKLPSPSFVLGLALLLSTSTTSLGANPSFVMSTLGFCPMVNRQYQALRDDAGLKAKHFLAKCARQTYSLPSQRTGLPKHLPSQAWTFMTKDVVQPWWPHVASQAPQTLQHCSCFIQAWAWGIASSIVLLPSTKLALSLWAWLIDTPKVIYINCIGCERSMTSQLLLSEQALRLCLHQQW